MSVIFSFLFFLHSWTQSGFGAVLKMSTRNKCLQQGTLFVVVAIKSNLQTSQLMIL